MNYRKLMFSVAVAVALIPSGGGSAAPPEGAPPGPAHLMPDIIHNDAMIDANKILMFATNRGIFGWDLTGYFGGNFGTFFPVVDTSWIRSGRLMAGPLYAAGLWLGGQVNGETRVSVTEYNTEFVQGPMDNGTYLPDEPEFRVYKLYSDSLAGNPNWDYANWPADQGAPVDAYGNPDPVGDQMLWTVYNDADPAQHNNRCGETPPLGLEVRQTIWASDVSGDIEIPVPAVIQADHVGPSYGWVEIEVTDHALLSGHDFMVTFEDDPTLGSTWDLIDVTTATTIHDNMEDQNGGDYPVDAGCRIRVFGPPGGVKRGDMYSHPSQPEMWGWDIPGGERCFTWFGADGLGWEGFRGALGWGGPGDTLGFGVHDPVPAGDLPRVLLTLAPVDASGNFDPNHPDVSRAYRYLRSPGPPARPEFAPYIVDADPPGGSYGYQDFERSCPLAAWNVETSPPQRLTVGYLENNREEGMVDGKYWPPYSLNNTDGWGPREWLWIYLDDYSETPNPAYQLNAINDPMPIMYFATWRQLIDEGWADADEFLIIPQTEYNNSSSDTFTFTASVPDPVYSGGEGMSIYIKYLITNQGSDYIENLHFGMWSDPDLGDAGDDLVGCDPEDNLFFCYNADDDCPYYYTGLPAVGFKLIHGPVVPSPGDVAWFDGVALADHRNLGLTAFQWFKNGTDPQHFTETYNVMRGLNHDGTPLANGTTFALAGDPVTGTGELDADPEDRRMLGSTGPIDMAPGDTQYLLFKLAIGQGTDRLTSVTSLRDVLHHDPGQDCPFEFIATNSSAAFLGQVTINGLEAAPNDCVGAFDSDGNCAGAASVTFDKQAYIVLQIYGDDPTTPTVDEGMNAGETFTLRLHDASANMTVEYPAVFDCWENTQGAPLDGPCGDPGNVYNFQSADELAFDANWNLISFDVAFDEPAPADVFSGLGDNLIYVTGFDGGSMFYDPDLPDFLNTLTSIDPGMGYWVKLNSTATRQFHGNPMPLEFTVDLDEGWNLIGCWPPGQAAPVDAFAALIAGGQLIYVTGFDEGSVFYDPSLPDFLNTLDYVRNGFGYWVKTTQAVPGFTYPTGRRSPADVETVRKGEDELGPFTFTPTNASGAFMGNVVVQQQAAEAVDILAAIDESGNCAGAAYLIVNAGESYANLPVYGDDPTTSGVDEGMNPGERFTLRLYDASEGVMLADTVLRDCWENTNGAPLPGTCGDFQAVCDNWIVSIASIDGRELPTRYGLSANYPNPFNPVTTLEYALPTASDVCLEVFNVLGQRIAVILDARQSAGYYRAVWNGEDSRGEEVSSGVYFYRLRAGDYVQTRKMMLLK